MRKVEHNGLLLAMIVNECEFRKGLLFYGSENAPLQLGSCVYDSGKKLQPHIHKIRERIPEHKTLECLYIRRGKMLAKFYSLEKKLVCEEILSTGDWVMLYDGGHGFEILEDNTMFVEVKNGQYVSVEADKEKFSPR